jgi:quinolinate synthase
MLTFDKKYLQLTDNDVFTQIAARKAELGDRLVILAHHYQPQETFQFADFTGDSLKLSQQAADQKQADYIVFCGVHFMAEVARMLCGEGQHVILPELAAGCSMADMATAEQVEVCWDKLTKEAAGRKIVPITYINSSAAIKAFCGRHDGAICTSGNGSKVLTWALEHGDMVLFLPDQHLGRNTAYSFGIGLDQMVLYGPTAGGGFSGPIESKTRMVLWAGCCCVHMIFTAADVDRVRREQPAAKVIVHPECRFDVVQAADEAGSTEYILKRIRESADGSVWAVGTESAMVDRLAEEAAPGKTVFNLSASGASCPTMKMTEARKLLWVLDHLAEGRVVNEIFVDPEITRQSRLALERMLELRSKDIPAVKR